MCQVDSASFYSNVAAVNGGGISQSSSPGSLTNTLFSGNKAQVTAASGTLHRFSKPTIVSRVPKRVGACIMLVSLER